MGLNVVPQIVPTRRFNFFIAHQNLTTFFEFRFCYMVMKIFSTEKNEIQELIFIYNLKVNFNHQI